MGGQSEVAEGVELEDSVWATQKYTGGFSRFTDRESRHTAASSSADLTYGSVPARQSDII